MLFLGLVLFAVALAVLFLVDIPEFRRDTLPAIRRTWAGADGWTPRMLVGRALAAVLLAVAAGVCWTLFAVGVDLHGWSRPLAVLSSLASIACIFWVIVAWRGSHRREGN